MTASMRRHGAPGAQPCASLLAGTDAQVTAHLSASGPWLPWSRGAVVVLVQDGSDVLVL